VLYCATNRMAHHQVPINVPAWRASTVNSAHFDQSMFICCPFPIPIVPYATLSYQQERQGKGIKSREPSTYS
jgi:hypothetical protein